MNLVEKFVPVIRVIVAVVFMMGFHCICHSMNPYEPDMLAEISEEKDQEEIDKQNALSEIEELLRMHDIYKYDKHNPDSAIVYVIPALDLAYSVFGYESKKYVEIFTDYFLPLNIRKIFIFLIYNYFQLIFEF